MEEIFMQKELLMLQHLGIDGALINYIVNHFSREDRDALFAGGVFELQFKYNVFSENHLIVFYDENKLKQAEEFVDNLINMSKEQNVRILSYYDKEYPSNLKTIKGSPLFVYVKGDVNILNTSKSIACVGTRAPTKHVFKHVGEIVKVLVEGGSVIHNRTKNVLLIMEEPLLLWLMD
jgi:DNA processing protein